MRALASAVDLEVVQTRYRGDATGLAADARRDGCGLILTLGGDGTVNEAINGILGGPGSGAGDRGPGSGTGDGGPGGLPALAPLPGGSANVFTRALGLPPTPLTRPAGCCRRSPTGAAAP